MKAVGGAVSAIQILVDADACPVKQEIYRIASRYDLPVTLVANSWMRIPDDPRFTLEIVEAGLDEADDRIVERVCPDDIVVTADVPLASRCLERGARVLGISGRPFTENSIGGAMATRDLLAELRDAGEMTGGPPPLTKGDRSRFLHKLDETIQAIRQRRR